jgi:hypothetical protein
MQSTTITENTLISRDPEIPFRMPLFVAVGCETIIVYRLSPETRRKAASTPFAGYVYLKRLATRRRSKPHGEPASSL